MRIVQTATVLGLVMLCVAGLGCDRKKSAAPASQAAKVPAAGGTSSDVAQTVGNETARVGAAAVEGAGHALKSTGRKTGEALGEGVATFVVAAADGVAKGIPDRAQGVPVKVSPELAELGVVVNSLQCKLGTADAYLVNKKPFAGTLVLKMLDGQGKEVGRSKTPADFESDDGKMVHFTIDSSVPFAAVGSLELNLRPGPPATLPKPQ